MIPSNGETIAILRRDVVAFVVPTKSSIDKIPSLAGKTIGIPQGPLQKYNEQTLDSILSYYNIPANSVKRVFLPLTEIGAAVHDKQVAAVLAVGPMGPGEVVDVVGAIKLATKGAPQASSPSTRRTRSTSGFPVSSRSTCLPEPSGGARPSPAIR